jgi:Mg-chelatase subunit ChlD
MQTLHQKISKTDLDLKNESKLKMPLLVTVETDDVEDENFRQGVDVVLLVDVSGSMHGEKIELVKQTLDFIIDELEDRDRVSIITFNSSCQFTCDFMEMNNSNKNCLKERIKTQIMAVGMTNILAPIERAFQMIINRKKVNDSTAIFLISDGQDTRGNSLKDIQISVNRNMLKMKEKNMRAQFHCFGYGKDHDEKVLNLIAEQFQGNFYYIKTFEFIDECFIDCFGLLMSNIGKEVELEIHLSNGISFESVIDSLWEKKTDRVAIIKIPGIPSGKKLEYTAEIAINLKKIKYSKGKILKLGEADLNFSFEKENFNFSKELKIEMVETNDEKDEPNHTVEENYFNFQGILVMEKAKQKLIEGDKMASKKMMNGFVQGLEKRTDMRSEFVDQMRHRMDMNNLYDDQVYVQAQFIMKNNMGNQDFSSMNRISQNFRQKKMKAKKEMRSKRSKRDEEIPMNRISCSFRPAKIKKIKKRKKKTNKELKLEKSRKDEAVGELRYLLGIKPKK